MLRIKSLNVKFSKVSEAVARRFPVKRVFLKTVPNLLENIRVAVFTLLKFHAKGQQIYFEKDSSI